MSLKLHERNHVTVGEKSYPTMVDLGDRWRTERRTLPELNSDGSVQTSEDGAPLHKWIIYESVDTGVEFHEEELAKAVKAKAKLPDPVTGVMVDAHDPSTGFVHRSLVKKFGRHPVIMNKRIVTDDNGVDHIEVEHAETTHKAVWVIRGRWPAKSNSSRDPSSSNHQELIHYGKRHPRSRAGPGSERSRHRGHAHLHHVVSCNDVHRSNVDIHAR
jgi:hypothetical protein